MVKKRLRKWRFRIHHFFALIGIVFLAVGSWAVFSIVNQGVIDILTKFGITNFYIQMGTVILLVLIGLLFSGMSIWRAFGKIAKGA